MPQVSAPVSFRGKTRISCVCLLTGRNELLNLHRNIFGVPFVTAVGLP